MHYATPYTVDVDTRTCVKSCPGVGVRHFRVDKLSYVGEKENDWKKKSINIVEQNKKKEVKKNITRSRASHHGSDERLGRK